MVNNWLSTVPVFHFKHIPSEVNKDSVKVFKNTKHLFSLEYEIYAPNTVHINLIPFSSGRFRKPKLEQGLAITQLFASEMGLHQDFHLIQDWRIQVVFPFLQRRLQIEKNGIEFYCGGIYGKEGTKDRVFTTSSGFTDSLLEILTDSPHFALLQMLFKAVKVPKEFQTEGEQDKRIPQVRFDIQAGTVSKRYGAPHINVMEEAGCFEFSPRILLAESSKERLKEKLNRVAAVFQTYGFKVKEIPTFFHRFARFKGQCASRKMLSPILLDGHSLMNLIVPPQRQYTHDGYSLVPNKTHYSLSANVSPPTSQHTINFGIPILSGKTNPTPLFVDGKDLCRHMAVFGMTGEGKSRFVYGLLKEFFLKGVKFIIFDPKGEYLRPVQSFCSNVLYLKPGSIEFPWGVNIFQVSKDERGEDLIPLEDHVQFVVSVFENILDDSDGVSPQMRRMLHLAILRTIQDRGDFRTLLDYLDEPTVLGLKGAYIENTAAGLLNRIEKLFFGNTGRSFSVAETTFEIAELLNRNVIIDLSAFESMEDQRGRNLFLEVILHYLYYFLRRFREPIKEESLPQNTLIFDEVQKLLPTPKRWSRQPESMIGKGPWTLRAYDISMIFIGTDPVVDQPMLSNTGITTIFYTNYNPQVVSNMLGLSYHDYDQMRRLLKAKNEDRRCIISVNGQSSLLKTNEFPLDVSHEVDWSRIHQHPLQQQIKQSYDGLVFNPVNEMLRRSQ
ncbi:MAG: ATP-binding protein [Candidatus Thorarchaeota archaeon]